MPILKLAYAASALACLLAATAATAAAPCVPPAEPLLRTAWQGFRTASLAGDAPAVAGFVRFPLLLRSPFDGVKPIVISRPVFLHNYRVLFQVGPAENEVGLYTDLKKSTDAEPITPFPFDMARCRGTARIGDYDFTWRRDDGWKIESMYYGGDFDLAKDAKLHRIAR